MTYMIKVYEQKKTGDPDLLGEYEFQVPPKVGDILHPPGNKNYGVIEAHHGGAKDTPGEMTYRLLTVRL